MGLLRVYEGDRGWFDHAKSTVVLAAILAAVAAQVFLVAGLIYWAAMALLS
jgi:hypothetical protein